MKNIFLDCGTHLCEGLKDFWKKEIIKEDSEVHTFEPNPECFAEERVKELPFNVIFHNAAVWINNDGVLFSQENHKKSKSGSPTDKRSEIDGWASSVKDAGFNFSNSYEKPIQVNSIDFSEFVKNLPGNSKIICKMDIEGSEFKVLRKMIEDKTIQRIDSIYVEFHERWVASESQDSKNQIIKQIEDLGVKIYPWA